MFRYFIQREKIENFESLPLIMSELLTLYFLVNLTVEEVTNQKEFSETFDNFKDKIIQIFAISSQEQALKKEIISRVTVKSVKQSLLILDQLFPGECLVEVDLKLLSDNDRHKVYFKNKNAGFYFAGQKRAADIFKGNIDEHLHFEGVAGSGKTHLISAYVDILLNCGVEAKSILILSATWVQKERNKIKWPKSVISKSYGEFAKELIPNDLTNKEYVTLKRSSKSSKNSYRKLSASRLIELYGVQSMGAFSASVIVRYIYKTIDSFCVGKDMYISAEHAPNNVPLSEVLINYIVSFASLIWKLKFDQNNSDFNLREIDYIKYCAINRFPITNQYLYVLLDETQAASKAMFQILDASNQAVITFCDPRQNLKGYANNRATINTKYLNDSYRAGSGFERLINPIISIDNAVGHEFVVNSDHKTKIMFYKTAEVPNKSMPMIVNDEWGMLEWAQRLSDKGCDFNLIGSVANIGHFVTALLDLKNGRRTSYGGLYIFNSLNEAVESKTKGLKHDCDTVYHRIQKMIMTGYSEFDWEVTRSKNNVQADYSLATVFSFTGLESTRIWLGPCIYEHLLVKNNKLNVSKYKKSDYEVALSSFYTSATRVINELYLPNGVRNFIEDIKEDH